MATKTPVPFFPLPPAEYDQQYLNEVVRSFSVFLNQFNNTQQVAEDDTTALSWFMS
mgnify:FL=1|tara:strand:+ start:976 stop:1143 length:168 start_codon:yes stop_codon:yes gene_type:complete